MLMTKFYIERHARMGARYTLVYWLAGLIKMFKGHECIDLKWTCTNSSGVPGMA
jgi:hypothetical protein